MSDEDDQFNPYMPEFDEELQQERQELLEQASGEQTTLFYNGSAKEVLTLLHIAVREDVVDPQLAREVLDNAEEMREKGSFGDVT